MTEPRWLTDEEREAWIATSGMLLLLPGALDSQLQRDTGLTLFEYMVLSRLSMKEPHTLRMSELASVANGSLSRLSNVVKRLEERGWLYRRTDPADGRFTIATLTDEGMAQVVAAAPSHVEAVRRYLMDGRSAAQLEALTTVGRDVLERLRVDGACRPG